MAASSVSLDTEPVNSVERTLLSQEYSHYQELHAKVTPVATCRVRTDAKLRAHAHELLAPGSILYKIHERATA